MAGFPKIQFVNPEDGPRALEMLERIIEHRYQEDLEAFNRAMDNIKNDWPDATIHGIISRPQAGNVILSLLSDEIERIERGN